MNTLNEIRNRTADKLRTSNTLDEQIQDVLGKSKAISDIVAAAKNPAIKSLISYFKDSVVDLQRRQNQLSESPERHLEEIRSLNALRKVTESFVLFFDIPKHAKEEVYKKRDHLIRQKKEAELRERQNNRF